MSRSLSLSLSTSRCFVAVVVLFCFVLFCLFVCPVCLPARCIVLHAYEAEYILLRIQVVLKNLHTKEIEYIQYRTPDSSESSKTGRIRRDTLRKRTQRTHSSSFSSLFFSFPFPFLCCPFPYHLLHTHNQHTHTLSLFHSLLFFFTSTHPLTLSIMQAIKCVVVGGKHTLTTHTLTTHTLTTHTLIDTLTKEERHPAFSRATGNKTRQQFDTNSPSAWIHPYYFIPELQPANCDSQASPGGGEHTLDLSTPTQLPYSFLCCRNQTAPPFSLTASRLYDRHLFSIHNIISEPNTHP